MREELVEDALRMDLGRRCPPKSLLHHSDRGVQYASNAYQACLQDASMVASMSRKGNCWDNSMMEQLFFHILRNQNHLRFLVL